MSRIRIFAVILACLALVLPHQAIAACGCSLDSREAGCECMPRESGGCPCKTAATIGSCCSLARNVDSSHLQPGADLCQSQCDCSNVDQPDLIVTTVPEFEQLVSLAGMIPCAVCSSLDHAEQPVTDVDRPPIEHSRRQAMLCVWLK